MQNLKIHKACTKQLGFFIMKCNVIIKDVWITNSKYVKHNHSASVLLGQNC